MPQLVVVYICRCRNCAFAMRTESVSNDDLGLGAPPEAERFDGRYWETHARMFPNCRGADFYYQDEPLRDSPTASEYAGQFLPNPVGADAMLRELQHLRNAKVAERP